MTVITIKGFRGAVPRYSKRLLQPNQAQRAANCRITSGRLDPLLTPLLITTTPLAGDIRSMFRYRHFRGASPTDNWLTWVEDVNVVLSPLANDARGTFFFTSEAFDPRVSNYDLAIGGTAYPDKWFALGLPNPVQAPSVAPTGGSAPNESRSYAYTFVTAAGEESGPSPASTVTTGKPDGSWALSNLQVAPPNAGTVVAAIADTPVSGQVRVELNSTVGMADQEMVEISGVVGMTQLNGEHRVLSVDHTNSRVVVELATTQAYTSGGTWARSAPLNTTGLRKRIYRTAGTNPAFMFVAEIDAADTTYTDTVAPTAVGEPMATAATQPPPKNLHSLISLPNGCLVGLAANEVCFSDPYLPYSWPIGNRYSFSGRGVTLVKAGNSVIVLTDTFPILFTGSDPEAMSPSTMETYAPCVSKRGAVDVGGGAVYPSFDGLWLITPGQVRKLTQNLYRDEEWKALRPELFEAAYFDGQYIAQFRNAHDVPALWVLDISEPDSAIEVDDSFSALHRSQYDGLLYVARGKTILRWNANDNVRYESDWHSKVFQMPRPTTFNVAQVFADFGDIIELDTSQQNANEAHLADDMMAGGQILGMEILGAEINGSLVVPLVAQTQRRVQFTLYKDGEPVFTTNVTSSKPFRLPTGYRTELASIHMAISVPTYSVAVASSVEELKQVAP